MEKSSIKSFEGEKQEVMRLLVVSDLHVQGEDDPIYRSLLILLRDRCRAGDALVLAGDLFDLFVGGKRVFVDRYREFFDGLRAAAGLGVRIHYIEGNHDFLLKRAFTDVPNLEMHDHDVALELGGRRFFVAHGDTVDRSDIGYLVLRRIFRSPVMKALVAITPGAWLDRIGRGSSAYSRSRKPILTNELPIERAEHLRRAYRSYAAERVSEGFDFVVMGHCHDLDEMSFRVNDRLGHYMNVGYPRVHGSFVVWDEGDADVHREPMPGA